MKNTLNIIIASLFVVFLSGCSGNVVPSTPDEIFDAIDGMSNHSGKEQ